MKHLGFLIGFFFIFNATSIYAQATTPLTLWYDQEATHWEEALPIGNGRLGAMIYGAVDHESIQLNEDTFWAGGPHNNLNPKARTALPTIRKLIDDNQYTAASELAEKTITSQGAQGMPYQTAGNLRLHFNHTKPIGNYYRDLDLTTAIAHTRYSAGGVNYEREVFSSFTDDVIVVRLKASQKGALNFEMGFEHPAKMEVSVNSDTKTLMMQGVSPSHEGITGQVKLVNLAKIIQHDGNLITDNQALKLSNATSAIILVSIGTNFVNYKDISANAFHNAQTALENAQSKILTEQDYLKHRDSHTEFYQQFFNRVSVDLGNTAAAQNPTDKRIAAFANTYDPALIALYFQFGRYLLIASSQPGTQPANLQGIWNPHAQPPWDSKYTLNINAEMNYWPAEVTNLTELHEPFIDLIRDLAVTGQEAARTMYGASGWVAHHNTDIWRISGAVDWSWGSWPTSNAWLAQHLWQKYLYTGDINYLRSVYPLMKGACDFFEDFLIEDKSSGWLIVSPSISPENEPLATGKKIAKGVTMDNQLLFDLFSNTVAAAGILKMDKAQQKKWRVIIQKIPPMHIGQYHQLQEWLEDWDNPLDQHRHVSHLYGLHPSNQISPNRTPDLFNAARVSMEQRGDPSTGWSMNWKINIWARLLDGNRALRLITNQIKPAGFGGTQVAESGGTYPNLFDAHPPFQIDGNFGFTAGIAEMLAQSHDGAVHLLPALPEAWPNGEIKGLVMRGGFVIDMAWQKGQITSLNAYSRLGGNLRLRSYFPLPKNKDIAVKIAKGNNPNPFYAVPTIKKPLKNTQKMLPLLPNNTLFEIDVNTKPGNHYLWTSN